MPRIRPNLLSFSFILSLVSYSPAQIREVEPFVLLGAELSDFNGVPVSQFHLFSYKNNDWVEIPMQIDERSAGGSLFEADDGVWDDNDELIFQPQDGCIDVAPASWIDNDDSKNYLRNKIQVYDPVKNDSAVVYLYRSATIGDTVSTSYIDYEEQNDEIFTESYKIGFDDNLKFWDELRLNDNGSLSDDLLDREKNRMGGNVVILGDWLITEEDLIPIAMYFKSGKIRITRHVDSEVTVLGQTVTFENTRQYYRSYFSVPMTTIENGPTMGTNLFRVSFDFTVNAIGAIESDEKNSSLTVDGVPDANVQRNIPLSQMSHKWIKVSLTNNSVVVIGDFTEVANTNKLYFHDNYGGGSGDGSGDTGDMVSYGDLGLQFEDLNSGNQSFSLNAYIGIDTYLVGQTIQSYFDAAFEAEIHSETFPGEETFNGSITTGWNLLGRPLDVAETGTEEVFLNDSFRLKDRAVKDGVGVVLDVWDDMWHVWHALTGYIPEAKQAIDKIGDFIRKHINSYQQDK